MPALDIATTLGYATGVTIGVLMTVVVAAVLILCIVKIVRWMRP